MLRHCTIVIKPFKVCTLAIIHVGLHGAAQRPVVYCGVHLGTPRHRMVGGVNKEGVDTLLKKHK